MTHQNTHYAQKTDPKEVPAPFDPKPEPLEPESPQPMDPQNDPVSPEIPEPAPPLEDPGETPFDDENFPV